MAVSVQAQFTISLNLPGPLEIVLDSPSFRLTSPSELEHVGSQRGPGIDQDSGGMMLDRRKDSSRI